MKDSKGRGVARLGDTTSHGGRIITSSYSYSVLGISVSLEGDKTDCPLCKGIFPIVTDNSERKHEGKPVAYHGDRATCGATLVSSIGCPVTEVAEATRQTRSVLTSTQYQTNCAEFASLHLKI